MSHELKTGGTVLFGMSSNVCHVFRVDEINGSHRIALFLLFVDELLDVSGNDKKGIFRLFATCNKIVCKLTD